MDAWCREWRLGTNFHIECYPVTCFGPDEYPFAVSHSGHDNVAERTCEDVPDSAQPISDLLPGAPRPDAVLKAAFGAIGDLPHVIRIGRSSVNPQAGVI